MFWGPDFFNPIFCGTQHFLNTKIVFDPKIYQPKVFVDKTILDQNSVQTKNYSDLKISFTMIFYGF